MDNSSQRSTPNFFPSAGPIWRPAGGSSWTLWWWAAMPMWTTPSFGTAIISRLLEAEGYKIGVLAQPRYTDCEDFKRFGKPKYGFFIGGGNVDSMVSHYSVAKIPRAEDEYSPAARAAHARTAAPPCTPALPSRPIPTCR